MKYIALHTMTEYSFLQSTIKIDQLIAFALANQLEALAITDRNHMFGVGEFVQKCQKQQIKPIIGVDLDVEGYRIIVLAKNYHGYQKLCELVSTANLKALNLMVLDDPNLIVLDHPRQGYFAQTKKTLPWANYYVGTNDLSASTGVFLPETQALKPEDVATLKILAALRGQNATTSSESKHYVLAPQPSPAVLQAVKIAKMCQVEFPQYQDLLPQYPNPEQLPSALYFRNLVKSKAQKLLADKPNYALYQKRLTHEVKLISDLGFTDYFLIITDLVAWAKSQKIAVGPGRGSAAGSLVAYVLGITEIDPLVFNLIFERFLNPERISMPDIDLDLQDTRREEVIAYLVKKYGQANVGLISTFQRLGAKSAIRDVARLKGFNHTAALALTKLIPLNLTLAEAFKQSARFRAAVTKTPETTAVFELAQRIEGLPRQIGTHAAGIVLSPQALTLKVPVTKSAEGYNQVQYSMDYLEAHGLLKIDLLGLRNLTIIQAIQEEVYRNYQKKIDFKRLPLNDQATLELLSAGDTNGVFQFESYGMKKTLIQVGVTQFADLVAILALYRPGPMEYINTYALRKNGQEAVPCINPTYDQVVQDTFGIIIYQEQIMEIAQKFAQMSFGQADILRRAISKKKAALIASLKQNFIAGAQAKGIASPTAEKVYHQIEAFANYGFNKSHAVAYATISYRLAFLKARFPFEFYTAIMQASLGSLPTLKTYIFEAKKRNIQVYAPNINISELTISNLEGQIILPLSIVKGLGKVANQKILQLRAEGKFTSFANLVARLKTVGLGEAIVLALIKANALRDFANMATLLKALPVALRYAEIVLQEKKGVKTLDFQLVSEPQLLAQTQDLKAEVLAEQEIYGFAIEASLTKQFELNTKLVDLALAPQGEVVAMVSKIKVFQDKNGQDMALLTLFDSTMSLEVFVFAKSFATLGKLRPHTLVQAIITYNPQRNMYALKKLVKEFYD